MGTKNALQAIGLRKIYEYIDKNPEENLPKLGEYMDRFLPEGGPLSVQLAAIKKILGDPNNNWYRMILDIFTNVDAEVRRTVFENLILNATLKHKEIHDRLTKQYDCNIPWAILMDPTSACNLHCTGCWAAEYGNRMNLTYEELDDIINQANALGCYFFLYTGGEPLVRRKDLIRLCEAHPDSMFSAFTNATLIDEDFADEMLRVRNFVPAISAEGFEESTDSRRGTGTYRKIMRAMEILREKKLPFGISACYTSVNVYDVGSEEYFDQMVEWGAKFCWFFTYMPVGKAAAPELMVTAEQRKFMYEQIRRFRSTKPIFTMDFWNDGEYSGYKEKNGPGYRGGCIAGGRRYLHINAGGDIEPCAFIHYSDSNIREKTLLEALRSPLFMGYRRNQPFHENLLRPCPVLDNPGALTRLVEESKAKSTDYQAQETAEEYSEKCVEKAEKWAVVAEELWKCSGHCKGCLDLRE
ncbi:MAG: radical SAM protein [Eubacteriales bacterium]|nr:radical SAM protein [Eubacteriales bacterium]